MTEKRLRPRLKVSIPVQVIGKSISGEKFREACQTVDASAFGVCIKLQTPVEKGIIVHLSMRMPRKLRLYDLAKDSYEIYAQVQHIKRLADGTREVGLCFLGKNPPPGYELTQLAEYKDLPDNGQLKATSIEFESTVKASTSVQVSTSMSTQPHSFAHKEVNLQASTPSSEQKSMVSRETRYQIPMEASIEYVDDEDITAFVEQGLVTNISKNGACVMATQEARAGSKIRISIERENFSAQATIQGVNKTGAGVWSLHVKFLDNVWKGGE
ncbi:MAG: PilZ domain-containing protein [Blastocatellia bacterium]|nr:PilZ domain-containing protein [Blastocatellia bacterium]